MLCCRRMIELALRIKIKIDGSYLSARYEQAWMNMMRALQRQPSLAKNRTRTEMSSMNNNNIRQILFIHIPSFAHWVFVSVAVK